MKLTPYILLLGGLLLSSCKEFLDLKPVSSVSSDGFYQNVNDFRTAVNAAYASLQGDGLYGDALHHLAEVPSDNVSVANPGGAGGLAANQFEVFQVPATNASIGSVFATSYAGIQRCNIVIDRIGAVTMDEAVRNQFIGEVRFIRALLYFNLVRLFGDVPLVVNEITSAQQGYEYGRAPVADVYKLIVEDLTDAELKLPVAYTTTNVGRVTRGAAKGLLGKVYLTQKNYAAAVAKLKEVIDLGGTGTGKVYDLAPNYADNFDPAKSNNVGHKESLFEIQYKTGGIGEGSPWTSRSAPAGAPILYTGVGIGNGTFMNPTDDIVNAYKPGDLRKDASIAFAVVNRFPTNFVKKYLHWSYGTVPFAAFDADHNWPVLRYADVLLMYAEAINEVSGPTPAAYDAINRVRRRAYGVPVNTPSATRDLAPGLSKEAFFLAVEDERRFELAFENHRWFDLIRTGRAIPVMQAKGFNIQPFHVLWPIPQADIDINPTKITQNPGY